MVQPAPPYPAPPTSLSSSTGPRQASVAEGVTERVLSGGGGGGGGGGCGDGGGDDGLVSRNLGTSDNLGRSNPARPSLLRSGGPSQARVVKGAQSGSSGAS